MAAPEPLSARSWRPLAEAHAARMARWTEPRRRRRARQETHPVYDFLFDYYRYSTAKLTEWHPPPGVGIEDGEEARERFRPPLYQASGAVLGRDPRALAEGARRRLSWTLDLLRRTDSRPPWLECFGVHEWAMAYRTSELRHGGDLELRLPRADVDRFVESQGIVCTHFDAHRFFSDPAKPLNRARPRLESRAELEQPGCVHANMDLYKWAYKSMPWIGSQLLADCFELAVELRELDMRASPYDVSPLGFEAISVETEAGRAEYVGIQRELGARAGVLRRRLIEALQSAVEADDPARGAA